MELNTLIAAIALLFASLFGTQQDDKKVERKAVFVTASGGGSHSVIVKSDDDDHQINIDGTVFDASSLKVGESKVFTSEKGDVTVSRDEDGLRVTTAEGEDIRILGNDDDDDTHVFAMSNGGFNFKSKDEVVIQGLDNLDEETQARIRKALKNAGVEKDVTFSEGGNMVWVDAANGSMNVNGHGAVFISGDDDKSSRKKVQVIKIKKKSDDNEEDEDDDN